MATTRKPAKPGRTKPGRTEHATHHGPEHDPTHGAEHEPTHGHEQDDSGGANITLTIRLGPMVSFQIEGRNCTEINAALKGFEHLNRTVDAMFSDLAKRVYPDLGHAGKDGGKD